MTKFVKVFGILIGLALVLDYVYSTSKFALERSNWLISDFGPGHAECADTYPFDGQRIEKRGITWDVQYRFIDLKLIVYDAKTGEMACTYATK